MQPRVVRNLGPLLNILLPSRGEDLCEWPQGDHNMKSVTTKLIHNLCRLFCVGPRKEFAADQYGLIAGATNFVDERAPVAHGWCAAGARVLSTRDRKGRSGGLDSGTRIVDASVEEGTPS